MTMIIVFNGVSDVVTLDVLACDDANTVIEFIYDGQVSEPHRPIDCIHPLH